MSTATRKPKRISTRDRKPAAEGPLSAAELDKMDAYWRALNYLSVGQIYLLDNPLLKEPLKREHIKPRLLGHWGTSPGLNMLCVHLNRVIKRDDLNMIYIIGPGHGGPSLVAHAYLEGTYSEFYPNISQDEEGMQTAVQAVQLSRRHSQPRCTGNAGQHPRRRRTGLRAEPCLRRRVRQSGFDRRLRRRRRRSGDRAAGHGLARQQVSQSGSRRLRAADPSFERLQDRQSVLPGPHPAGRTAKVLRGHGLQAVFCRRQRPRGRPSAVGRRAGHGRRRDQTDLGRGAQQRRRQAPRLADDRLPHAEGLDLPAGNRRQEVRGLLAQPSGADGRHGQAGPHPHPRTVDEELSAGGAVRRRRPAEARTGRAGPEGPPPDERQSARQRRPADARPEDAGLPRLRGRSTQPRRHHGRVGAADGQVPARRHEAQPGQQELPPVQPRREQLEPLAGRAGSDQRAATWPRSIRRTTSSARTAA